MKTTLACIAAALLLPTSLVFAQPDTDDQPTTNDAARPNVILMMADDLGWGDVGFNGGRTIKTPALDAMAAGGMVFERFYAAAPVCSPTRGSMLTGRHPYRLDIPFANRGFLKPHEFTLAELLRARDYGTGHFGKWHLGTLTTSQRDANRGRPGNTHEYSPPWENGFDVCFSTEAKVPTWDPMWRPKSTNGKWWPALEQPERAGVRYGTAYWDERGREVSENLKGCDSRVIVDRVEPFIRQSVEKGQPFFAVVWFHAPHLPVVAGKKYLDMYPDAPSEYHAHYYGCVTALDEQVGRIRGLLRELGVEGNTLLTFCSDNGPEGNDRAPGRAGPFRGRKRSLLEGGVRVPGVIEWPEKIPAGSRTHFAAVTSDLLPTIAEVVEVEPAVRPLDGVSLLPVFAGKCNERAEPIGFASRGQAAWHEGDWKIHRARANRPWELFNLKDDPSERNDLAEAMPERVEKMAERYQAWRDSCEASRQGDDYCCGKMGR